MITFTLWLLVYTDLLGNPTIINDYTTYAECIQHIEPGTECVPATVKRKER